MNSKKSSSLRSATGELIAEAEDRLYESGAKLGLMRDEMARVLDEELERVGAKRVERGTPAFGAAPVAGGDSEAKPSGPVDPFTEFRRVLRLSKLCLDGDEMTDDQRDALCNMGESLGLTGGEAEDIIDEYLEEAGTMPLQAAQPLRAHGAVAAGIAAVLPR